MMDQKMVKGILWNDYYKVAWVNIVTGDYDFVKILETEEEKPCLEARTIYEYSELIVFYRSGSRRRRGAVPALHEPQLYHEGSHGEAQQGHGEFPAYHRQRREVGQA